MWQMTLFPRESAGTPANPRNPRKESVRVLPQRAQRTTARAPGRGCRAPARAALDAEEPGACWFSQSTATALYRGLEARRSLRAENSQSKPRAEFCICRVAENSTKRRLPPKLTPRPAKHSVVVACVFTNGSSGYERTGVRQSQDGGGAVQGSRPVGGHRRRWPSGCSGSSITYVGAREGPLGAGRQRPRRAGAWGVGSHEAPPRRSTAVWRHGIL